MVVMTGKQLAEKCIEIAKNFKTLYVMGCFGAPLNGNNVTRYCSNHTYNKKTERKSMIKAVANKGYFGFDCVCLIKSILWGWNGDTSKTYGGAVYKSNGVPDIGADAMIKVCSNVSTDFSKIEIGEAVWMQGHIGVYIGDGLAVECTPIWNNSVQITAVGNIGKKNGYNTRYWTKHGKLPYVSYESKKGKAAFTVKEWQKAAIADGFKFPKYGADGQWGGECEAVAKKAIVKKRLIYTNKNLTKLVQKVVGVTADGLCGNNTVKAIKEWQKKNGLTADGCVGINSWKKMLNVK